jgi:3-oxoacyl-[acyl-carrier protein] reductase
MQSLSDQVAVITGGGQGIGRAVARVLAAEGARVAVADVEPGRAEATAAELRAEGHEATAYGVDVVDRDSVAAMADGVLAEWGRIDILAAVAGIYPSALIAELSGDEWDRVMDVNVKGALYAVQACLPSMRGRGYGRIVLMSSITGPITGQTGFAHYGASKAAMLGFMRSVAVELAAEGVTINAVMPGNVRTEGFATIGPDHQSSMLAAIPMGRLAEPEDIGWAVRILAAPESGYITGQTLIVDGGQVLPEGASSE